jgi:hypothetical protein
MEKNETVRVVDPIKILEDRINQCIKLSVPEDKYKSAKEMIGRSADDLLRVEFANEEHATKNFKNFVNKSLSTIEVLGLTDMQYKAARKLIQNEIYNALKYVVDGMASKVIK